MQVASSVSSAMAASGSNAASADRAIKILLLIIETMVLVQVQVSACDFHYIAIALFFLNLILPVIIRNHLNVSYISIDIYKGKISLRRNDP